MPGIYLRHGESYIAMTGQAYQSESVLQALIAQHPEILAGEDPNGRFLGLGLGSVGKGVLGKAFSNSVKAIEAENNGGSAA